MKDTKRLGNYVPLVNFIADLIGPHCEVLLHDVSDVQKSGIAIRNGYISGRTIGCPMTDLGLELLENKTYLHQDAFINYLSRSANGDKFRSSTYFIRDENRELIGMLCVNIMISSDNQAMKELTSKLVNILSNTTAEITSVNEEEPVVESLNTSVENLVDSTIHKCLKQSGVTADQMSTDDKIAFVQVLNNNGIFKIKGAISKVASTLQISESTVYRYLSNK